MPVQQYQSQAVAMPPVNNPQLAVTAMPMQQASMPVQMAQPQPGYLNQQQNLYEFSREDLVIRVFFQDSNVGPKLRTALRPELFKDENNRTIVDIINRFEHKYSKMPTAQELITGMGQNDYAMRARAKLMYIYNTPLPFMHQEYVLIMVESFFREMLAEQVLVSAAEKIHDSHVDGIKDLIPRLQEAVTYSLHTDLGLNFTADADIALAKLREQKQCIPSRINEIRFYTGRPGENGIMAGGGYFRKTLTLFVGQPNIGKSLVLCSEAAFAYLSGFNVLYITLELAEDYVWQRLAANICDTDFYDVIHMTGDQVRQKVEDQLANNAEIGSRHGQLQVRYMKTTTTPIEIESTIDSFEVAHGKLDLLVIDYIGIMKPASRGRVSESSMYTDGVMKAEQLRDLAIDRNFACLSAVQFNRTGYHNTEAGIESVEGSSGYAETSDLMISLTANEIQRNMGMFCHYILKSRLGPANVMFLTRCNFKKMVWMTPTPEEVNAYNIAAADADPQINAPQRQGGKAGPKRAIGKPQEATSLPPLSVNLPKPQEDAAAGTVEPDTISDYI